MTTNMNNVHLNVHIDDDRFNNKKTRAVNTGASDFGESIFSSNYDDFKMTSSAKSSSPFGNDMVEIDVRQMAINGGQKTWHPIRLFFPREVAEAMGLPLMEDRGKTENNPETEEIEDETDNETDDNETTVSNTNPWEQSDNSAGYMFDYTTHYEYDDGTVEEEYVNPNAKEGETFIKRTVTKPDGTVEITETVKGKEGEDDIRTKTTENPDGSKETEQTVKNEDDSYTTTTEKIAADGSKTIVVRIDYPDDTWVEETTDKNGNVTKKSGKYSNQGV